MRGTQEEEGRGGGRGEGRRVKEARRARDGWRGLAKGSRGGGAGPSEVGMGVGPGPVRTLAAPVAGWGQGDRTGCPRVPGPC